MYKYDIINKYPVHKATAWYQNRGLRSVKENTVAGKCCFLFNLSFRINTPVPFPRLTSSRKPLYPSLRITAFISMLNVLSSIPPMMTISGFWELLCMKLSLWMAKGSVFLSCFVRSTCKQSKCSTEENDKINY